MPLFLVTLHFKFHNLFPLFIAKEALQRIFHSVQNLVHVELDAFFFQRVDLYRYFFFCCIDNWKAANMLESSCCEDHSALC